MSQEYPEIDEDVVYATDPEPKGKERPSEAEYPDKEWLHFQYWVLGKTQKEIANEVGVCQSTVSQHMRRKDIPTRELDEAFSRHQGTAERLRNEDWLREKYSEQKFSAVEIAEMVDVSTPTIYRWMEKHGIATRDKSEANTLGNQKVWGDRKYNDSDWLRDQYVNRGKSINEIADENGWHPDHLHDKLKESGIQLRTIKSAVLNHHKRKLGESVGGSGNRQLVSSQGIDASWRDFDDRAKGSYVQYRDPKWLREQVEKGMSQREIAEKADCHRSTIKRWMKRHNIGPANEQPEQFREQTP